MVLLLIVEVGLMPQLYRSAMNALYYACVSIAGVALVLISAVIPWAVFTRYVLNSAASWPEPMAVLLTIVLTFFGAAACYRLGLHMNVNLVVNSLPERFRPAIRVLGELLMGLIAVFMAWYGTGLVEATWGNSISDFPGLSVGITYLPIPVGGVILLLFVIERLTLGAPTDLGGDAHSAAAFE
jgi:TRAP-type C4-dicarboxylate transport system permease small subunit